VAGRDKVPRHTKISQIPTTAKPFSGGECFEGGIQGVCAFREMIFGFAEANVPDYLELDPRFA